MECIELDHIGQFNRQYREEIKTLRTNIGFLSAAFTMIMFTSTAPNEGKTRDRKSTRLNSSHIL